MIIFKSLKYRNFLSTGNNWTEIDLTATKSTLIVGHNGAGKSTMLDALSFALYGKAHRNINKPQLVNSINNKDCQVEVEFTIGKSEFRIHRGLKPQIFEIWKNGTMINQEARALEYQKVLELNILKMTHKSFHQIVVLGSSSFIPFMQLSAQHRRAVIEDLLDINVFSKMNILIKSKQGILRDKIRELDYNLELNENRIDTQKKYIRDIDAMNNEEILEKKSRIKETQGEIQRLEDENSISNEIVGSKQEEVTRQLNAAHDRKQSILSYKNTFNTQIKSLVKEAKFYEDNTACPTCTQEIVEEVREGKLHQVKKEATTLQEALTKAEDEAGKIADEITRFSEKVDELRKEEFKIRGNNQEIGRLQKTIDTLNKDIERLSVRGGDLNTAKCELEELQSTREDLRNSKFQENESYSYNACIAEMLKDTGIKTKVIKQYLPVINKLVNQYLQTLDFFVHFDLDEEFKETIRSRHRDAFSYDSFSEGEKQRVDLALLFTWRMIAKMKNSVSTNLLLLDETFDSSLDHEGVDNLMKILYTLEDDTNTFVISHKGEILDGKFKRKIEFVKEKNFSKIATLGVT